ncbi:MAG: DUF1330 domain-containing protein [Alphaproteobacteria bacterium]|nr:DUF1330 domain-containing protein [Alphaproteobacteria bacterium]
MKVVNAVTPAPEQLEAFFGAADEGPFVMVNLLKFREKAAYADGTDAHLSGREAYQRYAAGVQACIRAVGGKAVFAGNVTGLLLGEVEENWDMVALVEYPSLESIRNMFMSPEYQAIEKHRNAGLAGQLNIRTRALG